MRGDPYLKFSRKAKLFFWLCLIPSFFAAPGISPAQTFTTLASFHGPDGEFPSSLVQGSDGKIWGTTGGINQYCGNVFKITTTGTFDVVQTFDCTDGSYPGGLLLGTDGSYYGYTFSGGNSDGGTIFKLTPGNVLTALYNFIPNGSSGSGPLGITQGTDGNFYGTTYGGGSASSYGTVFKMTPSGNLTTLYQFDFTHGAQPYAGMIQGTDGNFYGTTYSGGSLGQGTVFRITPQGVLTVLHNFSGGSSDGSFPVSALIQGQDGAFYGSTPYGGPDNDGTIFKITSSGTVSIVHSFIESDGRDPGPPVQAANGNFYGATAYGGSTDGSGTLFMMTSAGVVTTLHNFDGNDGSNPYMLIQDTSGVFFGTTGGGGDLTCDPSYGCGTVFSLALGLGPFVETMPAAGRVGTKVTILGTNLTGATGVTFNGTASSFQLISSSEITATVPRGATSGKVRVTKASGALASKSAFRILR